MVSSFRRARPASDQGCLGRRRSISREPWICHRHRDGDSRIPCRQAGRHEKAAHGLINMACNCARPVPSKVIAFFIGRVKASAMRDPTALRLRAFYDALHKKEEDCGGAGRGRARLFEQRGLARPCPRHRVRPSKPRCGIYFTGGTS